MSSNWDHKPGQMRRNAKAYFRSQAFTQFFIRNALNCRNWTDQYDVIGSIVILHWIADVGRFIW